MEPAVEYTPGSRTGIARVAASMGRGMLGKPNDKGSGRTRVGNYTGINAVLQYNLLYILGGLGVLFLVVLFALVYQAGRLREIRKRFERLLGTDAGAESLEETISAVHRNLHELLGRYEALAGELAIAKGKMGRSLQRVGLVRFNAFPDTGGEMSFAMALLDETGVGVVLTSLYGREEARVFAKPVTAGRSAYPLSGEEIKAIATALAEKSEVKNPGK